MERERGIWEVQRDLERIDPGGTKSFRKNREIQKGQGDMGGKEISEE